MTSVTAPRAALSGDELKRLVSLVKGADSVELKLTVSDQAQRSTVQALGLDPLQAEIRQVFFFDTPKLVLDGQGVVVRARRSQKKGDDTVVKLRPVVPNELPANVRNAPDFGIEVDASPAGFVCSGSMKGTVAKGLVRKTLGGDGSIRKLFSKSQRALFAAHAPEGVKLEDLSVLGPIFVLKLKSYPKDFDRKLVSELWLYPDGGRILELSTKCEPGEAFDVAAATRVFLADRGIDLAGEQQTKTRTALDFFSKELASAGKTRAEGQPSKGRAAT